MTAKYIRKPGCEMMEMEGEYMILNTEAYTVTELNQTGVQCWNLFEGPNTIDNVISEVKRFYETDAPEVEQDIRAFVNSLLECGLLEAIEG